MDAFLDLSLQNASARGLVVRRNFQDVGRIDPVISFPAHDMIARARIEFVDGHIRVRCGVNLLIRCHSRELTLSV